MRYKTIDGIEYCAVEIFTITVDQDSPETFVHTVIDNFFEDDKGKWCKKNCIDIETQFIPRYHAFQRQYLFYGLMTEKAYTIYTMLYSGNDDFYAIT